MDMGTFTPILWKRETCSNDKNDVHDWYVLQKGFKIKRKEYKFIWKVTVSFEKC